MLFVSIIVLLVLVVVVALIWDFKEKEGESSNAATSLTIIASLFFGGMSLTAMYTEGAGNISSTSYIEAGEKYIVLWKDGGNKSTELLVSRVRDGERQYLKVFYEVLDAEVFIGINNEEGRVVLVPYQAVQKPPLAPASQN